MSRIAVFCGSRNPVDSAFKQSAWDLGALLARGSHELIYGGASVGLMGAVADGCIRNKGTVIGVMPDFMQLPEQTHQGLHELRIVSSMHERKLQMSDRADAFIALPGGFGTLDEIFEIITWRQIGLHQKPIGLLNTQGYFDSLLAFIASAQRSGLIDSQHLDFLNVDQNPEPLLRLICDQITSPLHKI